MQNLSVFFFFFVVDGIVKALIKLCGEAAIVGGLEKGVLRSFAKFFTNKIAGLRRQRNL